MRLGVLAPLLLSVVAVVPLVVFWPVLWYAAAAAFALFGALVLLMFLAFVVYAVARRRSLAAVFREPKSEADSPTADPGDA